MPGVLTAWAASALHAGSRIGENTHSPRHRGVWRVETGPCPRPLVLGRKQLAPPTIQKMVRVLLNKGSRGVG